jgi:Zn-dependent membrane protease YugP
LCLAEEIYCDLLATVFGRIFSHTKMGALSILLFVGTLVLSLWATWRVKAAYAKYSEVPSSVGLSGAEVAAHILQGAGINDVQIVESNDFLGDHYDPLGKRLVLSSANFRGTSTAAMGVAAHECGHAVQHKLAYAPLGWRMASVHLVGFANMAVAFLPIFGFVTHMLRPMLIILCFAWAIIMLFNLITLPVEFDASARAKRILGELGFCRSQADTEGVNNVLNAAALTYVAAFITSLGYFLYYLLPLLGGGRRNWD